MGVEGASRGCAGLACSLRPEAQACLPTQRSRPLCWGPPCWGAGVLGAAVLGCWGLGLSPGAHVQEGKDITETSKDGPVEHGHGCNPEYSPTRRVPTPPLAHRQLK